MIESHGDKLKSFLFWNRPPIRDTTRAADPLGFDALREAMADRLAPLLTGATVDADEYLWTLVGLRWARKHTGSSVDATIFNRGFVQFERALKQYWFRFHGWKTAGINVVSKICKEDRPDVRRPILFNQRAAGLAGGYIVSLRGMDLVRKNSLCVNDEAADRLLLDVRYSPPKGWKSSWQSLRRAFDKVDVKSARQRLGRLLFQGNTLEMTFAAQAVLARPHAKSWAHLAHNMLNVEQARLAKATDAVIQFESAVLRAFAEILQGKKAMPVGEKKNIRFLAENVIKADPFPSSWPEGNRLRSAMKKALLSLSGSADPVPTIISLHKTVTRDIRKTEPWIQEAGETPVDFQDWKPKSVIPDFRFRNLRTLLKQTRWRP